MDDLIARLESLLHRYATDLDQGHGDGAKLAQRFRKALKLLVAEYGLRAVDAALDEMPDEPGPSITLH
jgi:hypothetical protein